jgi:hypothetical protein
MRLLVTDLVLTTKARILNVPARISGELVDETCDEAACRVLPRGGRTAGDGERGGGLVTEFFEVMLG